MAVLEKAWIKIFLKVHCDSGTKLFIRCKNNTVFPQITHRKRIIEPKESTILKVHDKRLVCLQHSGRDDKRSFNFAMNLQTGATNIRPVQTTGHFHRIRQKIAFSY